MFKIISPLSFGEVVEGERVAEQIATLLNNNNNLYRFHNKYTINNNTCLYIVYIHQSSVVGVTCIQRESEQLTRNKHTSVLPSFRRFGIGKKLINEAMNTCITKNMYATIRESNVVSINLYMSVGFGFVSEYYNKGHKIKVFGRRIK